MSISFEITEERPDHDYRTEIPNIVFQLGLDPYEFSLYAQIKNIAWDKRFCCKSYKELAKLLGCSDRKVMLALQKLESPFEKLNGKSLVIVQRERKDSLGGSLPNLLNITNIWPINGAFFRKDKEVSNGVNEQEGGGERDAPPGVNEVHPEEDNKENTHTHTRARERDPQIPKKPHALDEEGMPIINLKPQELERLVVNTIQLHGKSREEAKRIVDETVRQYKLNCGANGTEHDIPYFIILKWIDVAVKQEIVSVKKQSKPKKPSHTCKAALEPEIYTAKTIYDFYTPEQIEAMDAKS